MSFECKFCKKNYSSISSLNNHQKTAKHCLKIQQSLSEDTNSIESKSFDCKYCKKSFSSNFNLGKHINLCPAYYESIVINKDNEILILQEKKDNEIKELQDKIANLEQQVLTIELETENRVLREQEDFRDDLRKSNNELIEKLQELALASIDQKNELITGMIKKYVKKQPRQKFDEQNVIYILTTQSLQKDGRYILGKAKNLTNRLSTYNKTDEHKVIFYQVCEKEDVMNLLEPLVFKKLEEYREQANRERFILPEDKNIDFFIDIIKNCFEFLK
jgi:hypothetical protein